MGAPILAMMALTSVLVTAPARGAPPARDHPILGSWEITGKDGACSEMYRFRSDGTVHVSSRDEVAEIDYDISPAPSAKGFYRWKQRISKDNGGKDCSGKVAKVGDTADWYVQFDPSRERMMVCKAESLRACFGPLRKIRGSDT